jgi:hypothetical protein
MKTGRRQLLMGAALTAIRPAAAQAPFGREIVVRTVTNLRSGADVERLVELARAHRIATINVAAKQDEDDEIASGLVFYNSRIAPRAPGYEGFDALGEAIRLAHRHGMKVRAWLPQFHDQVAVRANPEWQMKAYLGGRVKPYVGRGRPEYFANPGHPLAAAYQRALGGLAVVLCFFAVAWLWQRRNGEPPAAPRPWRRAWAWISQCTSTKPTRCAPTNHGHIGTVIPWKSKISTATTAM